MRRNRKLLPIAGTLVLVALMSPQRVFAAAAVHVRIENHLTNDIRVGIFGWDNNADYRQDIPASGHDEEDLFTGWRGIVVWDNDAGKIIPMGGIERFDCKFDGTVIIIRPNKIDIVVPVEK